MITFLQNIPSHNKEIRMMFKATKGNYQIEKQDNCFILDRWDKVPTTQGYLFAKDLTTQNVLQTNKENIQIKNIQEKNYKIFVYV